MTTWLITTPQATTLVEVRATGLLSYTVPARRVLWLGCPWGVVRAWLEVRWGKKVTFRRLG